MDATAARSLLLRLALVIAVVAGLLAMHTLIAGLPHAAAAATVTAEHDAVAPGEAPSESVIPDDCGASGCLPLHAIGFMTCLLALIVARALSGAAPPAGRWMRASRGAAVALVATLRSVAPPPPSLVALSISRT